jgi:multidrug efflux pump subunit AcrA (membrane-fusion protein)
MRKKILLSVTAVVFMGGGIFYALSRPRGNGEDEAAGTPVFSVRTTEAQIRNLQAYIEINGNIVPRHQVAVVPDSAGKLISVKIDIGASVRKGQIIAEVDPSRPGERYLPSPVYAPVSGIIITSPLSVGTAVSTSTAITTISMMDNLEIEALIPEGEVAYLMEGLGAQLSLRAFPGEIFSARVIRVSPVVDTGSRTKKIVLDFEKPDKRVNSGMFARIKLYTREYAGVISIPTGAIVETRGKTFVYVIEEPGSVRLREVTVGAVVDDLSEIKSGLADGEPVVIQGQQFLFDGAAVRVIGEKEKP